MMQLVIKDGKVIATHEMHQDVRGVYPGCDVVTFNRPFDVDAEAVVLPDDPRTKGEKDEEYKDERRLAYPTCEEQLDMIYHDTVNGTTTWADKIANVKGQFPKPSLGPSKA